MKRPVIVKWQEHWLGSFHQHRKMGRDIRMYRIAPGRHDASSQARPAWRWMSTLPVYHPCHHSGYRVHNFVFVSWGKSGTAHDDLQRAA